MSEQVYLAVSAESLAEAMRDFEIQNGMVNKMSGVKALESLMLKCAKRLVTLYLKDYRSFREKEVLATFSSQSAGVMRTFKSRSANSKKKSEAYKKVLKILGILNTGEIKNIETISKLKV